MTIDAMMNEIGKLDSESRLELAWKLWDTLDVVDVPTDLSAAQKADLARRIGEMDANRDDVVSHDELIAHVRGRR